jgi:uncharacterized protein (TIGR01777 family)
MNCIVSGGTGFIGRRIVEGLLRNRHSVAVWSRKPESEKRPGVTAFRWDPLEGSPSRESLEGVNAVIHLAGEPVAQRWNDVVKKRIRDSRVVGTRRLVDAIARASPQPALVSTSAVGYYGDRGDEYLTENSGPGTGFLADVCRDWEAEANRASEFGARVAILRTGFVLGKGGGALAQILPVFRAGGGGRLGSGEQWMPWIHADDAAALFIYALETGMAGVWNATSPHPVRNSEFTSELAHVLHRPAVIPVPQFALKLVFGELARHMIESARVAPEGPLKAGFAFRFSQLSAALRDITSER